MVPITWISEVGVLHFWNRNLINSECCELKYIFTNIFSPKFYQNAFWCVIEWVRFNKDETITGKGYIDSILEPWTKLSSFGVIPFNKRIFTPDYCFEKVPECVIEPDYFLKNGMKLLRSVEGYDISDSYINWARFLN